ncbi:MAG: hypothetical protein IMW86_00575 [Hydrogenibacillus sp.]|nr:hypothetical protein [Hydrogenibacillus sp.]
MDDRSSATHERRRAQRSNDMPHEGKEDYWLDVDRMINEGLGGGVVSAENGLIEDARPLDREHPPVSDAEIRRDA